MSKSVIMMSHVLYKKHMSALDISELKHEESESGGADARDSCERARHVCINKVPTFKSGKPHKFQKACVTLIIMVSISPLLGTELSVI